MVNVATWTFEELQAYINDHSLTDENGEPDWDGAPWPLAVPDGDRYFCRVCNNAFDSPDEPHDCVPYWEPVSDGGGW